MHVLGTIVHAYPIPIVLGLCAVGWFLGLGIARILLYLGYEVNR